MSRVRRFKNRTISRRTMLFKSRNRIRHIKANSNNSKINRFNKRNLEFFNVAENETNAESIDNNKTDSSVVVVDNIGKKLLFRSENCFTSQQLRECCITFPFKISRKVGGDEFDENLQSECRTTQTESRILELKTAQTDVDIGSIVDFRHHVEKGNIRLECKKIELENLYSDFFALFQSFQKAIVGENRPDEVGEKQKDAIQMLLDKMQQSSMQQSYLQMIESNKEKVVNLRNEMLGKLKEFLRDKVVSLKNSKAKISSTTTSFDTQIGDDWTYGAVGLIESLNDSSNEVFQLTDIAYHYSKLVLQFCNQSFEVKNEFEQSKIRMLSEKLHEFFVERGLLKVNYETAHSLLSANKKEVVRLNRKIQEICEQNAKLKTSNESKSCLMNETNSEIEDLVLKLQKANEESSRLKSENEKLNYKLSDVLEENKTLKEEIEVNEDEIEDLSDKLQKIKEKNLNLKVEVDDQSDLLSESNKENEKLNRRILELSNEIKKLKLERENNNNSNLISPRSSTGDGNLKDLRKQLQESMENQSNLKADVDCKCRLLADNEKEIEFLNGKVLELNVNNKKLKEDISNCTYQLEVSNKKLIESGETYATLKVEIAKKCLMLSDSSADNERLNQTVTEISESNRKLNDENKSLGALCIDRGRKIEKFNKQMKEISELNSKLKMDNVHKDGLLKENRCEIERLNVKLHEIELENVKLHEIELENVKLHEIELENAKLKLENERQNIEFIDCIDVVKDGEQHCFEKPLELTDNFETKALDDSKENVLKELLKENEKLKRVLQEKTQQLEYNERMLSDVSHQNALKLYNAYQTLKTENARLNQQLLRNNNNKYTYSNNKVVTKALPHQNTSNCFVSIRQQELLMNKSGPKKRKQQKSECCEEMVVVDECDDECEKVGVNAKNVYEEIESDEEDVEKGEEKELVGIDDDEEEEEEEEVVIEQQNGLQKLETSTNEFDINVTTQLLNNQTRIHSISSGANNSITTTNTNKLISNCSADLNLSNNNRQQNNYCFGNKENKGMTASTNNNNVVIKGYNDVSLLSSIGGGRKQFMNAAAELSVSDC